MTTLGNLKVTEERYISLYGLVFWRGLYLISKYCQSAKHPKDINGDCIIRVMRTGPDSAHYDYYFDVSRNHNAIKSTPGLDPKVKNYIIASHDNKPLADNLRDDHFAELLDFVKTFPQMKLQSFMKFCIDNEYYEEAKKVHELLQEHK